VNKAVKRGTLSSTIMRLRDRQLVVAGVWVMILGPCHCARTKLQWAGDSDGSCSSETAAQQWKMKRWIVDPVFCAPAASGQPDFDTSYACEAWVGYSGSQMLNGLCGRVDIGERGGSNRGDQSPKAC